MFEPKNEMGVVVRFSQVCLSLGYEIIEIRSAYPDALIQDAQGNQYRTEFEFVASNFIAHRHDPRKCDLIVCWQNDLDADFPLAIWELSSLVSDAFVNIVPEDQKELFYLRSENRYLRRQLSIEEDGSTGDSMREIFEIMDRMYANSGRTPSQADVCRELAIARDGVPDGYERFKSYVNKIWRQWTPPQNTEKESLDEH